MRLRRYALAFVGALLLVPLATSCQSFADYCAEQNDCHDGNDRDLEHCEDSQSVESDRASLYGCSDEFDALFECTEAEAECENDNYGVFDDSCEDEQRDYGSCMSD
jgi:hypothetical protein